MGFAVIPPNYRVPAVLTEVDNSQANTGGGANLRALACGEILSTGTATANVPVLVTSAAAAIGLFGRGSVLARMCEFFFKNSPFGELWGLPLSDSAGTAATGSIVFSGTATAAGTFSIYIGGQQVKFACPVGMTATQQGAALVAACELLPDLPVTGVNTTGSVAVTAKNKGPLGNFIYMVANFGGGAAGEVLPAGTSVTITAMSSGATPPTLTTAIANMGDSPFDFIGSPWCGVANAGDSTTLDAWQAEMNATTGRWSPQRAIYGHVYSIKYDLVSPLGTLGTARNDPHMTIFAGVGSVKNPTPPWETLGAILGQEASSIAVHPAQPTQTLVLQGVTACADVDKFSKTDRNTLYFDGIAGLYANAAGQVCIDRDITTYQLNPQGAPDTSYLDSNTPHQIAFYLRYRLAILTSAFGRCILVNSVRGVRPGTPIATASMIAEKEKEIYADMCRVAVMENPEAFAQYLSVTRDGTDPNRVNSILPPDLANQLRVLAGLVQFRLQFPTA